MIVVFSKEHLKAAPFVGIDFEITFLEGNSDIVIKNHRYKIKPNR